MTKEARIYSGEKAVSLISGAWKTGQLHVKNEIKTLSNTIQTNKKENQKNPPPPPPKTTKKTGLQDTIIGSLVPGER